VSKRACAVLADRHKKKNPRSTFEAERGYNRHSDLFFPLGIRKPAIPRHTVTAIKINLIHNLEFLKVSLVHADPIHLFRPAFGAPSDVRNLELQPWDETDEEEDRRILSAACARRSRRAKRACGSGLNIAKPGRCSGFDGMSSSLAENFRLG
jgi:hypothetical protein